MIYLAPPARFASLLGLPEGSNLGKAENEAMRLIEEHNPDLNLKDLEGDAFGLYGQEKTGDTVKLAKMNLAVHGLSGEIREGNPPFNVDRIDKAKLVDDPRFPDLPKADNGNYVWIFRQVDRAHREFTAEQIEFLGNVVRLCRGEEPEPAAGLEPQPRAYVGTEVEELDEEVFEEKLAEAHAELRALGTKARELEDGVDKVLEQLLSS